MSHLSSQSSGGVHVEFHIETTLVYSVLELSHVQHSTEYTEYFEIVWSI